MYSCAIVGHRPTRFKFKYKEHMKSCVRLKKRIREQFVLLYEQGVRRFYIGGALGVDMWAGEVLLEMKGLKEYKDLEILLVLPFSEYDAEWDPKSKARMSRLKRYCSSVEIGSSEVGGQGYQERSRYMIDHADCVVAVYDNDRSRPSGVGLAVRYAEERRLPIILIHPDTAKAGNSYSSWF